MKNMKMALKIGLGFSLVVAVMLVLSGMAIMSMKEQESNAVAISDVYMPELTIGVHIDRAASDALRGMLNYTGTEDLKFADDTRKEIQTIRSNIEEAEKLIRQYPQLEALKVNLDATKPYLEAYTARVEDTVRVQESLKKRRLALIDTGVKYMELVETLLRSQEERLDRSIANNDLTSEINRRFKQTRQINSLLDMGAALRLSNFQSQVFQDPTIAENGMANFPAMEQTLNELDASVTRADSHEMIRQIREAAHTYAQDFQTLINEWKELRNINTERTRAVDGLLLNAQKTSSAALDQVNGLCDTSVNTAQSAIKTLIIGMIVGVVLSLILALFLTRAITGPLSKSVEFAVEVAEGHLDKSLDIHQNDEVGHLADALNTMVATLRQRIAEAQDAVEKATVKEQEALVAMKEADEARQRADQAKRQGMLDAAGQLENVVASVSAASEQLSVQVEHSEAGSQQQAARTGETATAMEEMNATVLEVAKNAGDTAAVSEQAKHKAQQGADIVHQVIGGMQRIQKGSEELRDDMADLSQKATAISAVMDVISDIADQTNLLALNAAIEAARAGEAGRGFAVVADEVRKLAENTMKATAEVAEAIQGIQQGTAKNMTNVETSVATIAEVTDMAARSGEALNEIVHLVDQASDQVRAIAAASEEQSATSEQINRAIEDIDHISIETADAMRLAGEAVQELSHQASILNRLIQDMKNS
ncbi:MAG: HAMP domain-containing protein [Desulfovibrionaceae bacterium]|nr:HAMP domain-containing protein [Desulfovibrionaceae bacterium]